MIERLKTCKDLAIRPFEWKYPNALTSENKFVNRCSSWLSVYNALQVET